MIRLFVAIPIPLDVRDALSRLQSGLPGARWTPRENFHLTLRFIGEVQEPVLEDIVEALWQIRAGAFQLSLTGIGAFGGERPRSPARLLYCGVGAGLGLPALAARVEDALSRLSVPPPPRKFRPHITLARLKNTPRERLAQYVQDYNLFSTRAFEADAFFLYESRPGNVASVYTPLEEFPLLPLT